MALIKFDDYAKKYQHIKMERRDGILQMTLHTNDAELKWGMGPHEELSYAFNDVARDHENRCVIITGTGDAFCAEVERRLHYDPRVVSGSGECKVLSWDSTGITARARWEFIGDDHPYNLIFGIDAAKQEMVIKDVNFRAGL